MSCISSDLQNSRRCMFDRIACRYDWLNRVMSLGLDGRWRNRAIDELQVRSGGRYLDIGCGTGEIALNIASRCNAEVDGIDVSAGMIAIAQAKTASAEINRPLRFHQMSAEKLDFTDCSFSGAIAAFTFRNIENKEQSLREIYRVLREGGRLLILELCTPGNWIQPLYRLYSRFIPVLGAAVGEAAAYGYLVESIQQFPQNHHVMQMLRQCGFVQVSSQTLSGGIVKLFSAERPQRDEFVNAIED